MKEVIETLTKNRMFLFMSIPYLVLVVAPVLFNVNYGMMSLETFPLFVQVFVGLVVGWSLLVGVWWYLWTAYELVMRLLTIYNTPLDLQLLDMVIVFFIIYAALYWVYGGGIPIATIFAWAVHGYGIYRTHT